MFGVVVDSGWRLTCEQRAINDTILHSRGCGINVHGEGEREPAYQSGPCKDAQAAMLVLVTRCMVTRCGSNRDCAHML